MARSRRWRMPRARLACNFNQPGEELLWQTKNQFKRPPDPSPPRLRPLWPLRAARAPAAQVMAAAAVSGAIAAPAALAAADVDVVRAALVRIRTMAKTTT